MKDQKSLDQASERIRELGIFSSFDGLKGWLPVQAEGVLKTGEFVYFHARHEIAEMKISRDESFKALPIAHYVAQEWDAGWIEGDRCVELIERWISQYYAGDYGFNRQGRIIQI